MREILFLLFFITGLMGVGFLMSEKTQAQGPQVSADCSTGRFILKMIPPQNHAYWAIRVHRQDKAFDPNIQNNENFKYNKYRENIYGRNVVRGNGYNWWVQSISTTGVWSEGRGGNVYCALKEPMYLSASYKYPNLTIHWRAVEGAVRYAVRVDDRSNGWSQSNMKPGDWMNDSVMTNSYTVPVARNKKISYWVYAIDKNGVWSKSSVLKTYYNTK